MFNDFKSKRWKTIENVSLESCSLRLEESGRIQDIEKLTDRNQNLKTMNRTRLQYPKSCIIVTGGSVIFLSIITPISMNHSKTNLFANYVKFQ